MNKTLYIAKAGLNRFYDEGFTHWPKEKLMVLFSNHDLETDFIQRELNLWKLNGLVEIPGRTDVYLIVLTPLV